MTGSLLVWWERERFSQTKTWIIAFVVWNAGRGQEQRSADAESFERHSLWFSNKTDNGMRMTTMSSFWPTYTTGFPTTPFVMHMSAQARMKRKLEHTTQIHLQGWVHLTYSASDDSESGNHTEQQHISEQCQQSSKNKLPPREKRWKTKRTRKHIFSAPFVLDFYLVYNTFYVIQILIISTNASCSLNGGHQLLVVSPHFASSS